MSRTSLTALFLVLSACTKAPPTPECLTNAECVPEGTTGEPRRCVRRNGAAKDSTTPFDEGYACGCVSSKCALVPGATMRSAVDSAVRAFTSARFPECTAEHITAVELRTFQGSTGQVWMNCRCGDDCGHVCTFDLTRTAGTWAVVDKEYACATK